MPRQCLVDKEIKAAIAVEYAAGQTLQQLGVRHEVSPYTIRRWVLEMGGMMRPSPPPPYTRKQSERQRRTRSQEQIERIEAAWALYEQGATMRQVAKANGVSAARVSQWFRAVGKQPRPAGPPYRPRVDHDRGVPDWVRPAYARYLGGATFAEAARGAGRNTNTLRVWLRVLGVPPCTPRQAHYHRKLTPEQRVWVVEQYKQGRSGHDLGKELGVTNKAIYDCLHRQGVRIRPPRRRGGDEDAHKAG